MIHWMHAGTPMVAAFLASLVECVEALTIVLAVGTVRGWRPALAGVVIGAALLAALVLAFGSLLEQTPVASLQVVIGVLLLLFGMRWLRKAILRAAGVIALHDEGIAFVKQSQALHDVAMPGGKWDAVALIASLKAVLLEGLEVVFIVIAAGAAGHALIPAVVGATAALVVVVALGILLHRPLVLIPENTLKFSVGILLSAFGAFWFGEGVGIAWPGADLALLGLIAIFLVAALISIKVGRSALSRSLTTRGQEPI